MKAHPDFQVIAASFCDSRASKGYNVGLYHRRSSPAKHGISAERIRIPYYGENHLINECADEVPCSEVEQQLNRRTEFYLIKDGKRVLELDYDWITAEVGK